MSRVFRVFLTAAFVFSTFQLFAQSSDDVESNEVETGEVKSGHTHPDFDFSLTMSPLHLALPMLELNGELKLANKFGMSLIGAYGRPRVVATYSDGTKENYTFSAYELGGQCVFYPIGNFRHGMQLGAEVLYVKVLGNIDNVSLEGAGLGVGPFIGYKLIFDNGITLNAQLGVERLFLRASASDSSSSANANDKKTTALLNLNVGYSF